MAASANLITLIVALIGVIVPLIAMVLILKQKSDDDYSRQQTERIRDLLVQLKSCSDERKRLEDENLRLMRRLIEEE